MEDSPPVEAPKQRRPPLSCPLQQSLQLGNRPLLDHLERNEENVHELLPQTKRMEKVLK